MSKAKVIAPILSGIGLPVGMDYLQHDNWTDWDKWRIGNFLMNAAIGAGAGHLGSSGKIVEGMTAATLAPAKDLLINLQGTPGKLNTALENTGAALENTSAALENANVGNKIALGLGAGALGLGALGIAKYLMSKDPKTDMGTMKIKLPGKKNEPGTEAEVTLPVDLPEMSPSMIEGLNKGVRLQARKNIKANSFKRDLITGKLIPAEEWDKLYRNEDGTVKEMDKAASRAWAEGAGSVITGLGSSLVGSAIGANIGSTPTTQILGSVAGAALGAAAPSILGRILAKATDQRTKEEQEAHDRGSAFEEYIIPGYASYNAKKREQGVKDDQRALDLNRLSFANTLSSDANFRDPYDDDYDYDEDEMDKYAGMAPPPPGVPMSPPPIDPKRTRLVPPGSTPPPAAQARELPTGDLKNAERKAKNIFSTIKSASMSARQECLNIMNKIYEEDPSYWPYGLGIPGHESVYLVRDNMTKAAAGFVGWQEHYENGRKIGSYSIGILPEYRNKGMAKEAVAKILREKSARVDEVRAYIVHGNKPSHALADSIGVSVQEKF